MTTLAGSDSIVFADGTGSMATFNRPSGVAISRDGTYALVADLDNNRVRHIAVATGRVTTLAGSGAYAFADGMGSMASFSSPRDVAISSDGRFALIADSDNGRVRRIEIATGNVTTLAGPGTANFADGTGSMASFSSPNGVAISSDDTFALVADTGNNRLRRIEIATGSVTTLAGSGAATFADGTGVMASFARLDGVSISRDGQFALVADQDNFRVRRIEIANGRVTTLYGPHSSDYLKSVPVSSDGSFALVSGRNNLRGLNLLVSELTQLAGSEAAAFADGTGLAAAFNSPAGVAISSDGTFALVADSLNNRVRRALLAAPCRAGFYCIAGSSTPTQFACDAGFYCSATGLSSSSSQAQCQAGSYCPAGSSASAGAGPCQAGFYCSSGSSSATQTPCAAGSYCPSGSTSGASPDHACDAGAYCPPGSNSSAGAGACDAGYFCPAGSTSRQAAGEANQCAPGTYCPAGSKVPALCPDGFYCPNATRALKCESTQSCPAGSVAPLSPSPQSPPPASPASLSAIVIALIVFCALSVAGVAVWWVWRRVLSKGVESHVDDVALESELDARYKPLDERDAPAVYSVI